jgi:hypothetical protein
MSKEHAKIARKTIKRLRVIVGREVWYEGCCYALIATAMCADDCHAITDKLVEYFKPEDSYEFGFWWGHPNKSGYTARVIALELLACILEDE